MNFPLYVLAAYTFTFVMIGWIFISSYRRYVTMRNEYAEMVEQLEAEQDNEINPEIRAA